ncbi:hypothetical protein [Vibrio mediterranei]|uniref:hypothetical protein n=1 Tax=Vibrio mediterranei TaxID=689 RepID=UPI004067C9D4
MKETALNIVRELGFDDVTPDYSGRGMYGRTTIGVTVDAVGDLVNEMETALKEEAVTIEALVESNLVYESDEDTRWYLRRPGFEYNGTPYEFGLNYESLGYSTIIY